MEGGMEEWREGGRGGRDEGVRRGGWDGMAGEREEEEDNIIVRIWKDTDAGEFSL